MFKSRWWIVVGSFMALLVGSGAINLFAFGVFVIPITQDLGISRGAFSSALLASGVANAFAAPVLGWLLDRYGVRKVMIPGVLLSVLATASYALMTPSLPWIVTIWAFAGIVGISQTPIGYTTIINKWFDNRRGLALGIATSAVGFGVVLVPQLAQRLLDAFQWRGAYLGLATAMLILAFLPNVLFLRDPEIQHRAMVAEDMPGLTLAEAIRSWRFWVLTLVFFLGTVSINGALTHVVPLLRDRGVPSAEAVQALSGAGIAIISGRILSGWLLDRVWGPFIALVFFGLSIAGLVVLVGGATGPLAVLGAMMCGAGIGAEIDFMGYFMSRYFGMRAFARIYGLMFVAFSVGTGLGPALSGWSYELAGKSYVPVFTAYMIALALMIALLFTLGPYRFKPAEDRN
jgi:MFS family permease